MGDIADILGVGVKKQPATAVEEASRMLMNENNPTQKKTTQERKKKPKGMSRELFGILGQNNIPQMQTNPVVPNTVFKKRVSSSNKGKWIWSDFTNSARGDGYKLYHWSKKDIHLDDYNYAKFNIKLDNVSYTDEEYEHLLKDDNWTKSDTDSFMKIAYKYDLRWPVIADRYNSITPRTVEELQARFYSIVYLIRNHRNGPSDSSGGKESVVVYNIEQEKQRRLQQDMLFRKVSKKDEDAEEVKIKEESKSSEITIKKKKGPKPGSKSLDGKTQASLANNTIDSTLSITTAEGLMPGRPCLQSTRLIINENTVNLSKTLLSKMQVYVKELGMPSNPLPTKAVCDAVDQVNQDAMALLSIHNAILKKEKEIASLRSTIQDPLRQEIPIPYSTLLTKQPTETRPFAVAQSAVEINENSSHIKAGGVQAPKRVVKRKSVSGAEGEAGADGAPKMKKSKQKSDANAVVVQPTQQQQQLI